MACRFGLVAFGFVFLAPVPAAAQAARDVEIRVEQGTQIDFLAGGQLIGRYLIDAKQAKPHFHPLNGPTGKPVTRGYPMIPNDPTEAKDHPHQRAAWFTHGDVVVEGITPAKKAKGIEGYDFWTEGAGHGQIVCTAVSTSKTDKGQAMVVTSNEWRTPEGQKVMDEKRIIRLVDLGTAKLFVVDIDLHASAAAVTFEDTKEGSFGVRVAETMTERKGGVLENAEGRRTEKQVWGMQSPWCDYSGPVDGKVVGIAIFDHPDNRHKAYWHSRGYGLMAANPFGRTKAGFPAAKGRSDLVKLAKGDHLRLRYAILIHPGDAKEGKVAEHYQAFAKMK
jgi:hypothetical protein